MKNKQREYEEFIWKRYAEYLLENEPHSEALKDAINDAECEFYPETRKEKNYER